MANKLVFILLLSIARAQIAFEGQGQSQPATIQFDDAVTNSPPSCETPDNAEILALQPHLNSSILSILQRQGSCKPLAQCALFYAEIPTLLERPCEMRNGQKGVCCPVESGAGQNKPPPAGQGSGLGSNGVLTPPPPPQVVLPRISRKELEQIAEKSVVKFQLRVEKISDILFNKGVTVPQGSPAAAHQQFFQTTNQVLERGNDAQLNIETSQNIANDLNLSPEQGTFGLPQITVRGTKVENTCPPTARCNPNYPYRTMDGSCNNRRNPDWGKSQTAFQRILPPKYGDGINSQRSTAINGQLLPSARRVSHSFIPDENRPFSNLTMMVMQWGQFLDHDLTHTPIVKGNNSVGISCCQNGQVLQPNLRHPDCFPIEIPGEDSFYRRFGQRCMEFVRSLPAPRRQCNFGPREQMNQITAWIDGSNIYGSSDNRARSLREGQGGRLLAQTGQRTELMPANPNECSSPDRTKSCFRAGDLRVNEQVELALMHTVWMREHNRIARALQQLNPTWSDEILYQETRRIVIAELQHITYNEFLPLILGPEYMRTFELQPKPRGYTRLYNEDIDGSITNAFATAAYRFGHSLIQGIIQTFSKFGQSRSMSFAKTQFQPFQLYDSLDDLVRGLTNQEPQKMDNFATDAVTNHLFEGSSGFGLDLMALNIQRGRDHGLPPYNDWREVCGLRRIQSWQDLVSVMDEQAVRILSQLYPSVDDIDLFVGGIGERPQPGAVLGPTFVCIVGDQFSRLRRGDRFFYEETNGRFTEAQLDQIRKVSLARIMCDNSDSIEVIQPLVFQQASFLNQRQPCNSDVIPKLDLRLWTERRSSNQNQNQNTRPPPPVQTPNPNQNFNQNQNQNFRPPQQNFNQNQNFGRPNQFNPNTNPFQQFQQNQNFGNSNNRGRGRG